MKRYELTIAADRDIETIARDSIARWGWRRAETYVNDLHRDFDLLVTYPDLGRDIGHLRPGYRRLERASHSVFYRKTEEGVLIVRVLHRRMQPGNYL